jgi:hypothetical protein
MGGFCWIVHRYALAISMAPIRAKALGQMAGLRHFGLNQFLDVHGIDASVLPAYKRGDDSHDRPCR